MIASRCKKNEATKEGIGPRSSPMGSKVELRLFAIRPSSGLPVHADQGDFLREPAFPKYPK